MLLPTTMIGRAPLDGQVHLSEAIDKLDDCWCLRLPMLDSWLCCVCWPPPEWGCRKVPLYVTRIALSSVNGRDRVRWWTGWIERSTTIPPVAFLPKKPPPPDRGPLELGLLLTLLLLPTMLWEDFCFAMWAAVLLWWGEWLSMGVALGNDKALWWNITADVTADKRKKERKNGKRNKQTKHHSDITRRDTFLNRGSGGWRKEQKQTIGPRAQWGAGEGCEKSRAEQENYSNRNAEKIGNHYRRRSLVIGRETAYIRVLFGSRSLKRMSNRVQLFCHR